MHETIEDIIRRIVREELAQAPARYVTAPPPTPGYFRPNHCVFCGGNHGGGMCPKLVPMAISYKDILNA